MPRTKQHTYSECGLVYAVYDIFITSGNLWSEFPEIKHNIIFVYLLRYTLIALCESIAAADTDILFLLYFLEFAPLH